MYCDSFLQGASTLIHLLRADRDGKLVLHLDGCAMLFHGAYLICCADLLCRQPISTHSMQWPVTKQWNRLLTECKSQRGVISFTLCKVARTHWLMTRHITAEYSQSFKLFCDPSTRPNRQHEEHSKSRISRDKTKKMYVKYKSCLHLISKTHLIWM